MSKKMDDARRASRERDLVGREEPVPTGHVAPLRKAGNRYPTCPECGHSVAFLHWNPGLELWECYGCGFTATPAEL